MARDLNACLTGLRVSNVYDIDPRIYVFKFQRPENKETVLFEQGIRVHPTAYAREKNSLPSPFTIKLRKYLRSRKCESVHQLRSDRILKFTFPHHVMYLEFFAKGNLCIAERDTNKILCILRPIDGYRVGDVYPESATPAEEEAAAGASATPAPAPPTQAPATLSERSEVNGYLYEDECLPYKDANPGRAPIEVFPSFAAAVDKFFSTKDLAKSESSAKVLSSKAEKKLAKAKQQQGKRIQTLEEEVAQCETNAQLIQLNREPVDEAIEVVRAGLAQGLDWQGLKAVFKEQRLLGNPVALLIHNLKLEKNAIDLELDTDDSSKEYVDLPGSIVEVDLGQSAMANVSRWFEMKKRAEYKLTRTLEMESKALAEVELRAKRKEDQAQSAVRKGALKLSREHFFFEKFNFFISSDHYLVIGGRDAQQNERLVKSYLRPQDLYVHADVHGASSCVIRNRHPFAPVPGRTITEAGVFAVAHSAAWDAKVPASAWYVFAHQVSKTAPSGEFLPAGSFMIRGQKTYIPLQPILMGFTIVFRVLKPHVAAADAASAAHISASSSVKDAVAPVDGPPLSSPSSAYEVVTTTKGLPGSRPRHVEISLREMRQQQSKKLVEPAPAAAAAAAETASSGKSSRGKASKMKKMKTKYKDQDQDDRDLMMQYLGHKMQHAAATTTTTTTATVVGAEHGGNEEVEQEPRQEDSAHAPSLPPPAEEEEDDDDDRDRLPAEPAADDGDGDAERSVSTASTDGAGRDMLLDENTVLDFLTGTPHEDDEFLFAMPMLAPYACVLHHRFRAKISHGPLKRGKAVKEIIAGFLKQLQPGNARDAVLSDLMRATDEKDAVQCMLSNVKVNIVASAESNGARHPKRGALSP